MNKLIEELKLELKDLEKELPHVVSDIAHKLMENEIKWIRATLSTYEYDGSDKVFLRGFYNADELSRVHGDIVKPKDISPEYLHKVHLNGWYDANELLDWSHQCQDEDNKEEVAMENEDDISWEC